MTTSNRLKLVPAIIARRASWRCTAQRKSLPALGGFRSHFRLGCALRPPNAKCPAKNDEDNDDKDEDQTTEHGWGYPLRTRCDATLLP
ncbi:MAG: hypothetical protein KatS3mg051_0740 [Anaerolineae bacterium]|nr:MAG: hypothetical protein KatS3mg051_0740 [Anaerolineae bacterium]